MLEPLQGLPDGVIGFEVTGEIHSDDYQQVLLPAIGEVLDRDDERGIRMVMVFPSFEGISAGASWQDLKMGVEHFTRWKRLALVTDVDWMSHLTTLFGWLTPGEVKRFSLAEREAAVAWAAED
jgi:hypothetical protein